jgi:hypothetical protein
MESRDTARPIRKPAGLALAGVLAAAGLWLAVGAGAQGGPSVRDAGYPGIPKACSDAYFNTFIVAGPRGKIQRRSARFKFEVYNCTATGIGNARRGGEVPLEDNEFVHYQFYCKKDGRPFRKCKSPKRLRGLTDGRHKFKVKATAESKVEGGTDTVENNPAVRRIKVDP